MYSKWRGYMAQKAKESRQIKKAREKLKKNLDTQQKKFTSEALQNMAKKIRTLLVRHHEPAHLRKRKFTIFDENAHSARTKSRAILKLQQMLQNNVLRMD
jgi:hypothetical protein